MALVIPSDTRASISIDDYVDGVRRLDLRDQDSLVESAPMLRALANDRTLVVRRINQEIEKSFRASYLPSAQTVYLGGGTDFFVRAAVWPSSSAVTGGRLYQDKFAYHTAHDHNFTFLTVNYLGPGYETEIYEYDYDSIEGHAGEGVDLRFLEKVRFGQGSVMLYRASRDVHIQYPPEELSVTLNLMVSLPEVRGRDQYFFDTTRKVILDYVPDTESSRSVALIRMAAHLGDDTTHGLLRELAAKHPSHRIRLNALEALAVREPARQGEIWQAACNDPAPLVVHAAQRNLKVLAAR
jgi:hypothetical protein